MFKNLKISKKLFQKKKRQLEAEKRKKIAKHLAEIKLRKKTSFGSMLGELSQQRIEEQLE